MLYQPSKKLDEIQKRHQFVREFLSDSVLLDKVKNELKFISDIEAILNRLALQRVTPRDLLNLKRSLQSLLEVKKIILESDKNHLKKYL
jgi:DNA mismatch repair protein MutS